MHYSLRRGPALEHEGRSVSGSGCVPRSAIDDPWSGSYRWSGLGRFQTAWDPNATAADPTFGRTVGTSRTLPQSRGSEFETPCAASMRRANLAIFFSPADRWRCP